MTAINEQDFRSSEPNTGGLVPGGYVKISGGIHRSRCSSVTDLSRDWTIKLWESIGKNKHKLQVLGSTYILYTTLVCVCISYANWTVLRRVQGDRDELNCTETWSSVQCMRFAQYVQRCWIGPSVPSSYVVQMTRYFSSVRFIIVALYCTCL